MSMPVSVSDRPVVRLKPKADARAIRHGAPWVFDGDVVLDRRTKKLAPGTLAVLEDAERAPLGLVSVNPGSRIAVRMLDRDPAVRVDAAWFAARLTRAQNLRQTLFDEPFYRLIHAEADGLPGVIVDRFGGCAVVQPNAAWIEPVLAGFTDALVEVTGVTTVLKNASGRARRSEGLDDQFAVLHGQVPEAPVPVAMNGATYLADLVGGQKTGLFYDQRPNHAFAARLGQGGQVLDVFSHVGGFGLAMLAGGAAQAVAVDGSAAALDLARQGAAASGFAPAQFTTRQGDAFDVLGALGREGALFDVVICDPPAFAPAKSALQSGLRAYERLARLSAPLVRPGGFLGLCSCSHAASPEKFRAACARGIGRAGREARLIQTGFAGPDHPQLPHMSEGGYLKALFFAL